MTTVLSELTPPVGANKRDRRVGRGAGSGLGKTCGRGYKGQKARAGGSINKTHFQGGQTPIQRRLPKRGFRRPFVVETVVVNVGHLERFDGGSELIGRVWHAAGIKIPRGARIKILGQGELTKALSVNANAFSESARAKILAAGGSVTLVGTVESISSKD